jgi:hypothetical protein
MGIDRCSCVYQDVDDLDRVIPLLITNIASSTVTTQPSRNTYIVWETLERHSNFQTINAMAERPFCSTKLAFDKDVFTKLN